MPSPGPHPHGAFLPSSHCHSGWVITVPSLWLFHTLLAKALWQPPRERQSPVLESGDLIGPNIGRNCPFLVDPAGTPLGPEPPQADPGQAARHRGATQSARGQLRLLRQAPYLGCAGSGGGLLPHSSGAPRRGWHLSLPATWGNIGDGGSPAPGAAVSAQWAHCHR